jgi:DNA segregation ATPase FtsK/SpoIIIE-like protein
VLCTQHPSIDVIPNTIKTNMTRVSGRMPSIAASMVVLDSISAAELPNIPGRLIFSLGRYEITAQSPFISDEEVAHAVYVSQQYAPSQSDSIMAIPEPTLVKTKFTANDAIATALARLDGQLSANKMISMVSGISHFELRRVIDTITNKEYVVHNEIKYRIKRVGKAYYLKTMETAMESENDDKMSSA